MANDKLPGGQYRHIGYFGQPTDVEGTIGAKAGSATKKGGIAEKVGKVVDAVTGNDSQAQFRAYTPQEAQKAQAGVDEDTMRTAAKGVAGAIPSYKHGGTVKKTGLALVHKGETVIPVKGNSKMANWKDAAISLGGEDKAPKKEISHIVTRKSANGGHVHEHHHTHSAHPVEHHVTKGDDEMVEHMLANAGTPNPGEDTSDQGSPAAQASAPMAAQGPAAPPSAVPGM